MSVRNAKYLCLLVILCAGVSKAQAGNDKNYTYLALGDSIAFGFDPTLFADGRPVPQPSDFIGYPEVVAGALNLLNSKKLVNASCPGESSGSFIDPSLPDFGCSHPHPQPPLPPAPPFRTSVGLKATYGGSQAAFAVSQLSTNKHINLVTLGIGSNDLLLVQNDCLGAPDFAACVTQKLQTVLPAYAGNLQNILTQIRRYYSGPLVLVKYYSPSPDPLTTGAIVALNQVMEQVGSGFGARFADGFTAFQLASALFGGDPCKAGLLVRLSPTACDVHPSPLGRNVLAAAVLLSTR